MTWNAINSRAATRHAMLMGAVASAAICSAPARAAPADKEARAPASATSTKDEGRLEEIVVTARRREESLQRTPVAVSAIGAADLARQQITDISQVQRAAPNVVITQQIGDPTGIQVNIRGQQATDTLFTIDPPVGIYVDDVYIARADGALTTLIDTRQVQVLRGPQGTLFGRNTTGGAVVLRTNDPTNDFGGSLQSTVGSYNDEELIGIINVPIVNDLMAFRAVGQYIQHDGYGKSLITNQRIGDTKQYSGRVALKIGPNGANWGLMLRADFSHYGDNGVFNYLAAIFPNNRGQFPSDPLLKPSAAFLVPGACAAPANAGRCSVSISGDSLANYVVSGHAWENYASYPQSNLSNVWGASATFDWDMGWASIKSVSAFRKIHHTRAGDLDSTPYDILEGTADDGGKQYSEELQVSGKAFDKRLQWVVGTFLFKETGFNIVPQYALYPLNPTFSVTSVSGTNYSYAGFAQATYGLTDKLHFTGGLRYSYDKRKVALAPYTRFQTGGLATADIPDPTMPAPGFGASVCSFTAALITPGSFCTVNRTTHYSYLSYEASVDYQVTPTALVYAKTSRAYRAGMINGRSTNAAALNPVQPERNTSYEVGAKTELFDRKLRANLAAYYSELNNAQVNVSTLVGTSFVGVIQNAAKVSSRGIEADFEALPFRDFRISGSAGHQFTHYISYNDPGTGRDLSGLHVARSPQFTANITGAYTIHLGDGTLEPSMNYSYTAKNYGSSEYTVFPSYGLLNGQIEWRLESRDLTFTLFARNLTNKLYDAQALGVPALGIDFVEPGPPRTFGFSALYKF